MLISSAPKICPPLSSPLLKSRSKGCVRRTRVVYSADAILTYNEITAILVTSITTTSIDATYVAYTIRTIRLANSISALTIKISNDEEVSKIYYKHASDKSTRIKDLIAKEAAT